MTAPKYPTAWEDVPESKDHRRKLRVVIANGSAHVEEEVLMRRHLTRSRDEMKFEWRWVRCVVDRTKHELATVRMHHAIAAHDELTAMIESAMLDEFYRETGRKP
jgi:hypothetical protein